MRNGAPYSKTEDDLIAVFIVNFLQKGYTRTVAERAVAKVLGRTFATIETYWTTKIRKYYSESVAEADAKGRAYRRIHGKPEVIEQKINETSVAIIDDFLLTHVEDSEIIHLLKNYEPDVDVSDYETLLTELEMARYRIKQLEYALGVVRERSRIIEETGKDLQSIVEESSTIVLAEDELLSVV